MYTSYFANLKSLPENVIPISICRKTPEFYKGLSYKKLAPSFDLLMEHKANVDAVNYEKRFYNEVLNKLDSSEVVNELNKLAGGKGICLVCYETPSKFCHRHLVGEWFNENGFYCEEWRVI